MLGLKQKSHIADINSGRFYAEVTGVMGLIKSKE
jgi:hypothetical protein